MTEREKVQRSLSFCISHKDRIFRLRRLLEDIRTKCQDFEINVADYSGVAIKDANVVSMEGDFQRSKSLNAAARISSGRVLFFIDVDMDIPDGFDRIITSHVSRGKAYFPICYSLNRDKPKVVKGNRRGDETCNGWWRKKGFGMCGFDRRDFMNLMWDESYNTWGGEDKDLVARTRESGIKIVREKCNGLYHIWHPENQP